MLSRETLRRRWPRARAELINGIAEAAPRVFAKYGFERPLEVAVFMAHCTVECGGGCEIEENLNYSSNGLIRTWPRHFNSRNAAHYAHKPQKIANYVYEPPIHKDLGNRPNSNDGWDKRGRGGTNITGAANYEKVGKIVGLDLVNNPELVNDPRYFLECAVADFVVVCNCLEPAKRGDMRLSCRRLNGGYIGLADREHEFTIWKSALAAERGADSVEVPIPPARPAGAILRYGDQGDDVKALQQNLASKGYACGADDGQFHEATRDAVNAFKADNDLPTDGSVDHDTKTALQMAPDRPLSEVRQSATLDDLRAKGSRTVAAADKIGRLGQVKMAVGTAATLGGGAIQSGEINLDTVSDKADQAQAAIDKAKHVYGVVDGIKDALLPLLHNPVVLWGGVALLIIGFLVWIESRKIANARLLDHQTGAHLGR